MVNDEGAMSEANKRLKMDSGHMYCVFHKEWQF